MLDALALSASSSPGTLHIDGGDPEVSAGLVVTERFFDIIGARPALGRTFTADEYRDGTMLNRFDARPSVAVLSHALWRERFGGRSDVVGSKFRAGNRLSRGRRRHAGGAGHARRLQVSEGARTGFRDGRPQRAP